MKLLTVELYQHVKFNGKLKKFFSLNRLDLTRGEKMDIEYLSGSNLVKITKDDITVMIPTANISYMIPLEVKSKSPEVVKKIKKKRL